MWRCTGRACRERGAKDAWSALAAGMWFERFDRQGRISYKHVGGIGWETIATKLDEALQGVVSAGEGKGEYRAIR